MILSGLLRTVGIKERKERIRARGNAGHEDRIERRTDLDQKPKKRRIKCSDRHRAWNQYAYGKICWQNAKLHSHRATCLPKTEE
jgi:hypothetical protein